MFRSTYNSISLLSASCLATPKLLRSAVIDLSSFSPTNRKYLLSRQVALSREGAVTISVVQAEAKKVHSHIGESRFLVKQTRSIKYSAFPQLYKLHEPGTVTAISFLRGKGNTIVLPNTRRMSSEFVKPTIIIFYSSVRPGRQNERVGKFVKNVVENNGMKAVVFDPAEMPFEMVKVPLNFMPNPEEAPSWLGEANCAIKEANGFIIVSAEYNCGLPPALSNMLDHFPPASFRHRPCGIVTYSLGNFGGIRASTLIRPLCSELGMITVPTYVPIPTSSKNFDEEGNCQEDRIATNIDKLVKEVGWYASALGTYKKHTAPPS